MKILKYIRKNVKNITKIFRKALSKTPKRKFRYGYYYKHKKVNDRIILIESFHGQTVSDSGLVMAQEILSEYPNRFKIYFASENISLHQKLVDAMKLDVELIDVTTFKYTKILATAKYIISNASLPIYFVKRDEQVYLQTWHGTPLKTLGKKMRMGVESMYNVQHNFLQADYLTQPNDFTRDVIMGDYNLEPIYTGKVVMAGYPRNKIFMQPNEGEKLKAELGLSDKTVYAYMPTWRGTSNHDVNLSQYTDKVAEIFTELDNMLSDNQLFFVNFHPILHGAVQLDDYKHIKQFPDGINNYEFLNCADALITDYSSVFFDFSLTQKPIILFMYDYDEYLKDRGLIMDITTLPFKKIYDCDEFCDCLQKETWRGDSYTDTEYYRSFFKYDSPDVSKKLLNMMFTGDESDFEIIDYSHNKGKKFKVYHPEAFAGEADFRTFAEICDDNSIAMFEKKWFTKKVSALLHDKYNYSFNYIITTNTPPRTYMENFLAFLGVKSAKDRMFRNDAQRCFPNLDVGDGYIYDYSCFKKGCIVADTDIINTEAEYNLADGKPEFTINASDYKLKYSVALNKFNEICAMTKLDYNNGNKISFDIKAMTEELDIYHNESYCFGVIAECSEGTKVLVFSDSKITNAGAKQSKFDLALKYYTPIKATYTLPTDYFRYNIKKLKESTIEADKNKLALANTTPVDTDVVVMLSYNLKKNATAFTVCNPEKTANIVRGDAIVKKLSCNDNTLKMKLSVIGWKKSDISRIVLKLVSQVENIEIPFDYTVTDTKKGCTINMTTSFDETTNLREIFWDVFVITERDGIEYYNKALYKGYKYKLKVVTTNVWCKTDDTHILFPYFAKGGLIRFCYKEKSEYDCTATRVKEFIACSIYFLFGWLIKQKSIWVVFGKFCRSAQDNSYYFFKYCMENLSQREKRNIYYIIDKRSDDYKNIEQYGRNVIQFMSVKHILYCMAMNVCISSDSTTHLYVWRSLPSIPRKLMKKKKELFLQHGVTSLKKVDKLFGKKGSSPMAHFVTVSSSEHDIVVNEFGYKEEDAPITGFARWDVLENKENKTDKFILLMPTWRSWLEEVSNEAFKESDYYKNYTSLLTSPELAEILENNNINLVLYLHPKFAGYIDSFADSISKRIQLIRFGEQQLNELMMKCSMLITDYSSVCWDVLYMDKPVLFYQFDYELYDIAHGSYIDMENDLMGDRTAELDELIGLIEDYTNRNFKTKPHYQALIDNYFTYRDNNNSKRIYDYLKNRGY